MFSGLKRVFTRKRNDPKREALLGTVRSLLNEIRMLNQRVGWLEQNQTSATEVRKMAQDCMNRVTEMALVVADKDDLAATFRAQSRIVEGQRDEGGREPIEDGWCPKDSDIITYG